MQFVEDYVTVGNTTQRRDTKDFLSEFENELSEMQGKCLDIGSGPGDITKTLLLPILPKNTEIVGADISEEMVKYARKKYDDKRLSYIVLDIETSELSSDQIEQYDNAVSFYCLHWCNDLWRAFENIYKLLRPGAKALTMFLGYHSSFEAYIKLKQNPRYQFYLQDAQRYIPYFQRYNCKDARASLRKLLEDIGFKILHCSKREKTFQYSKQSLKNHACAVNPFISRLPDDMKSEFIDNLMNEILNENVLIPLKRSNGQKDWIILRYYLLIAYVQKPLSTA